MLNRTLLSMDFCYWSRLRMRVIGRRVKEAKLTIRPKKIDLFPISASFWKRVIRSEKFSFDNSHINCHISPLKQMSPIMRKPVFAICEQQRCRSACASMQSDQHHCWSLGNFWSWACRFESYLVENPEERFSHDVVQMMWVLIRISNTHILLLC